jgi:hypothetical protein
MAMKEQPKMVYRSLQGKEVDMNKLININELTPAVGNANVNARGDKLGPGGKIIQKREEILAAAMPAQAIPDQINVRQQAPTTPVAPQTQVVQPAIVVKNVAGQDPEGKE